MLRKASVSILVLALALVHHLAIANNVPLERIAELFAQLAPALIIEFVPKSDKKLKGAYKKVLGKGQQRLEAEVELPAGSHTITALAYSTAKDRQYEARLDVELEPGDLRTLRIVAGRTFGRQLTMKLD